VNIHSKQHIIVGISGGVDSSIAAYLLKQAGHHVEGIFMKNWEADDTDTYCPAEQDIQDAEQVCDKLGIELTLVNFANEYWERVFTHFLAEYRAGRTPNPDILCNKEIKFKAFLDYAKQRGADKIATGHYVCSGVRDHAMRLLKGTDSGKDQSYFLHALTEAQVDSSLFPVGDLNKVQVREIAKELGLVTHAKKDSTGICFIGERKFKQFLNDYLPAKSGKIETLDGEEIGHHDGLMFHTIGQRQGLQIGGMKGKSELPWYVAAKDMARNVLIAVQGDEHPALYHQALQASQIHWINQPAASATRLMAKVRYRQADQACMIENIGESQLKVSFEQPQRAITPGQSIVFYQDDICLGGGIIDIAY
jgi:tRNA-specific 2-thiouridylase